MCVINKIPNVSRFDETLAIISKTVLGVFLHLVSGQKAAA
jgi:hypothetical protein